MAGIENRALRIDFATNAAGNRKPVLFQIFL